MSSTTSAPETTVTDPEAYDVIIVGGGPAGLTAGIYAGRNGYKTLLLEGEYVTETDYPGGQLLLTPSIENYPGFRPGAGADLVEIMREQAEESNVEIITEKARGFKFETGNHKVITDNDELTAKTVIIATGAIAKRLGVVGEDHYFGTGVSTCATCDGAFFPNQTVVVVGGGDTAVEDALYMSNIATKVYLIHRSDSLRAQSPESRTLLAKENVEVIYNTVVEEIVGNETEVKHVTLKNKNGETSTLETAGVFVAIGHNPSTESLKGNLIDLDEAGYIVANGVITNVPGVYVAGDVADKEYRQAITAAASGCQAAIHAQGYLTIN
jgi:thioredoxin reductase (NADPH)